MSDVVRILFVDDEGSVLRSLRRGLRMLDRDWQLEFCESPIEAISRVKESAPWVVVSDLRMLEMDGADLLQQVAELSPQTVRVMLSGDGSINAAVNSASIAHIMLPKPFDIDDLDDALSRACCLRSLPLTSEQRSYLGSLTSLPVLPEIYQELQRYLKSSDNVSPDKIADIIAQDVAVFSKVLQLSNSAFFGFSFPAATVKDAVVRLGVELIKQLVLCLGLFHSPSGDEDRQRRLFGYAMQVAALMAEFSRSRNSDRSRLDAAYLTGMLHNVGGLVPDSIQMATKVPLLSAYLLKLWGFEDALVERVLYQDKPTKLESSCGIVQDLYVVKALIKMQAQGQSIEEAMQGLPPSIVNSSSLNSYLGTIEQV